MKIIKLTILILGLSFFGHTYAKDKYKPEWESLKQHENPEWFQDAKFGIYCHWGPYSVPAFKNEWYSHWMYVNPGNPEFNKNNKEIYEHHINTYGLLNKFGYKDFIPMFKAEKFNPDEWVKLFKEAGAKYIVPVAEHHDGFAMYDSKLNPWNSVKMGPKKDIVGMLKKSIEKNGLIFGVSSHRVENSWFYNGGLAYPSDVRDTDVALYGRRLEKQEAYDEACGQDLLEHTIELVDKYKPSLVWFDWTVNNPKIMPSFNKFLAYYYNKGLEWKKGVVVNTKHGYPKQIHVWDMERGKAGGLMYYPWQTDTSIGKRSWCYIDGEENKDAGQIVRDLCDIVSKN